MAGAGEATGELAAAEEVGAALADAGFVVVTGGLGGVMEAVAAGPLAARRHRRAPPGRRSAEANGWVESRSRPASARPATALVVRAAARVVAIGGGYGTLSEIAFALKAGRPVVGIGTWDDRGRRARRGRTRGRRAHRRARSADRGLNRRDLRGRA